MAEEPKVYALDDAKNQRETMTREQIVTAIENMETTGSVGDVDAGFISKILELNKHGKLRFWVGSMAEFNALQSTETDTLYLFNDDPTVDDLEAGIKNVESQLYDTNRTLGMRLTKLENSDDEQIKQLQELWQKGKVDGSLMSTTARIDVTFKTNVFSGNGSTGGFIVLEIAKIEAGDDFPIAINGTYFEIVPVECISTDDVCQLRTRFETIMTIQATGGNSIELGTKTDGNLTLITAWACKTPYPYF